MLAVAATLTGRRGRNWRASSNAKRWPRTRVRGDGGFCRDGTWCGDNNVDYLFGLSRNARLTERVGRQLRRSRSRCVSTGEASRRFCDFRTRGSWSRTRRVVAKAEWCFRGARFVVTSLSRKRAGAQSLYEKLYCARGENRIKEQQLVRRPDVDRDPVRQRLYFATFASSRGVSETRPRRHRGRQGPGRAKFLKVAVCISVRRVPLSFSSTCDGTVRPSPGEPAGDCADVAPFAVPAASPPPPPPKAGTTELVCARSLPHGGVAVRNRERSSFVQERAHDSPAEPGFRTADRPENRAGNPDPASGSGEISGLSDSGPQAGFPPDRPATSLATHGPGSTTCASMTCGTPSPRVP